MSLWKLDFLKYLPGQLSNGKHLGRASSALTNPK